MQGLAPPSKLGVFNNTLDVAYKALAERTFMCKVDDHFEPALGTDWERFADPYMLEFLEKLVHELDLVPVISTHEVVDSYKGTKRRVYEDAEKKYWRDGVSKMDATLRMFVKFEKCDLSKAPRVINPRSPVYNLALGRFLKLNEHRYFDAIARVFEQERVVIKGMDSFGSAAAIEKMWNSFHTPAGVGGDASKFDMHVSKVALYFEHLAYILPFCNNVEEAMKLYDRIIAESHSSMDYDDEREQLCWLLSQQLHNRGKAYFDDGTIKFEIDGTRASGDLNTSLGNCILMCAMTYSWSKKTGVKINLANNGDDCMYIMNASDVPRWQAGLEQAYADKGFRMVLEEPVYELEQVEFCQAKPCMTVEGRKMVRNPLTLVTKGSMCLLPFAGNMKALQKWMMAVGVAEGSLGRGVPVVQSFARAMRRNGRRCSNRLINAAYYQSNRVYHADLVVDDLEITSEARMSFYKSFGIIPDHQEALERYYDSWTCDKTFGDVMLGDEALERVGQIPVTIPHLLEADPTI